MNSRDGLISFLFAALLAVGSFTVAACGDDHHHGHDECGGHGHLHGEHCHCDDGYEVDPEDATMCIHDDDDDHGHAH